MAPGGDEDIDIDIDIELRIKKKLVYSNIAPNKHFRSNGLLAK
jgi:hypothetical protein